MGSGVVNSMGTFRAQVEGIFGAYYHRGPERDQNFDNPPYRVGKASGKP